MISAYHIDIDKWMDKRFRYEGRAGPMLPFALFIAPLSAYNTLHIITSLGLPLLTSSSFM